MKVQEMGISNDINPNDAVSAKNVYKNKKKKRNFKWLKRWSLFVLTCTAIVFFALSPLFNIKHISVEGNEHYKSEQIINTAEIVQETNGFKLIGSNDIGKIISLRYGAVEKKLEKNFPYIKNVTVSFVPPSKVRIKITERKPKAFIENAGQNLVIDREGYILDTAKTDRKRTLPYIKGLKFKRYDLGQPLVSENTEGIPAAMSLMDMLEKTDADTDLKLVKLLDSVDVADLDNISIKLDGRLTVKLGELENMEYKIKFLKEIYIKGIKKDDKGVIDFSSGDNPSFTPQKN